MAIMALRKLLYFASVMFCSQKMPFKLLRCCLDHSWKLPHLLKAPGLSDTAQPGLQHLLKPLTFGSVFQKALSLLTCTNFLCC